MRLNSEIAILGKYCILVPYRKEHVPKYHEWMKDPQLLEATGSESLSLDAEYEMQASWRDDESKCTFIVLDREAVDDKLFETTTTKSASSCCFDPPRPSNEDEDPHPNKEVSVKDLVVETLSAMVGDVNLFFSELDEDDDIAAQTPSPVARRDDTKPSPAGPPPPLQAEIDIMIADPASRNKGIGREAVVLMMLYACSNLCIRRFFCKINQQNVASRTLFETKLGFRQCDYAECFQQYEYELIRYDRELGWGCTGDNSSVFDQQATPLQIFHCPVSNEED